jgi:cytochrome c oxidase assembly protein subunit 17
MNSSNQTVAVQENSQPAKAAMTVGKSGKKICCSCPETKKVRDECVVTNGQEQCLQAIEAHKACLRAEGFRID